MLVPLGASLALVGIVVLSRLHFFETVIRSRFQTGGSSTSAHFGVYDFIPQVLSSHPLFGLGLNNFSVYYEFVTGKTNWGPHSFYVALLVETGLVGTAVFAVFLWYLFRRLHAARAIGRRWRRRATRGGARAAARLGLTAALVGTMAANVFYLTMSFFYFYVFAMLALAAPVVFGARPRATTVIAAVRRLRLRELRTRSSPSRAPAPTGDTSPGARSTGRSRNAAGASCAGTSRPPVRRRSARTSGCSGRRPGDEPGRCRSMVTAGSLDPRAPACSGSSTPTGHRRSRPRRLLRTSRSGCRSCWSSSRAA